MTSTTAFCNSLDKQITQYSTERIRHSNMHNQPTFEESALLAAGKIDDLVRDYDLTGNIIIPE